MFQNLINLLKKNYSELTDGYHTFTELYECRHMLYVLFALLYMRYAGNDAIVYKTKKNHEQKELDGWFLLIIDDYSVGQISFHLPIKYWGLVTSITEHPFNENYDGHDTYDVIERLLTLILLITQKERNTDEYKDSGA